MTSRRTFLAQLAATTVIGASGFGATRCASAMPMRLAARPARRLIFRRRARSLSPQPAIGQPHYSFVAPASGTEAEFVQPDYAAWGRIEKGMTEAEVLQTLGEPIERGTPPAPRPSDGPSDIRVYGWVYGRIDFKSPLVPDTYDFRIHFAKGRVWDKYDPFSGPLWEDGKPSVPKLIYPASDTQYHHYPRYLDMRWYPSSGQYPVKYLVELQWGNTIYPNGIDEPQREWHPKPDVARVDLPYFLHDHCGTQIGRWRVKAVNALGESEWSDRREFEFRAGDATS